MLLPRYLLPSEQWGAWKERNIHIPHRVKKTAEDNAANNDPTLKAYLKTHFCTQPFDTIETSDRGAVHVCCPDWLPKSIGGINDLEGAWNSRASKDIRRSIADGSFKYCNSNNCELITNRKLLPRDSKRAQDLTRHFEAGTVPLPREVQLSHDRSCNLSCPSCRSDMIVAGKAKQQRLDDQLELSFVPIMKQARSVYITGSGDPFASAHFRRLIKRLSREEFPNLRFRLHTNAQLFDERAWRDLDLAGRVETVHISIDAASSDTYAVVRRGGTFARLLKNLEFIKGLRQANAIDRLEISMVVQALNFREMPAFAALGHSIAADEIYFEMIRDWGVYAPEEFAKVRVDATHPEYFDLVEVLRAPELHGPKIANGNLVRYVERHPPFDLAQVERSAALPVG